MFSKTVKSAVSNFAPIYWRILRLNEHDLSKSGKRKRVYFKRDVRCDKAITIEPQLGRLSDVISSFGKFRFSW